MRLVRSGIQVPACVPLQSILPTFRRRRLASARAQHARVPPRPIRSADTTAIPLTTSAPSITLKHPTHTDQAHTHTHPVPTLPSTDVLPSSTTHAPAPAQHQLTRRASFTTGTSAGQIQRRASCCVQRCMALYRRSQHSRIPTVRSRRTPARSRISLCALVYDAHRLFHRVCRLAHVADALTCLARRRNRRRKRWWRVGVIVVRVRVRVRARMRSRWSRRVSLIRRIWIGISYVGRACVGCGVGAWATWAGAVVSSTCPSAGKSRCVSEGEIV